MPEPTPSVFAELASAAYDAAAGRDRDLPDGWKYHDQHLNAAIGLQVGIYIHEHQGWVVASVRGTAVRANVVTDLKLVAGIEPSIYKPALSFIEKQFKDISEHHTATLQFYLTGHSLGALVAEMVAMHLTPKARAVTFDSPGSKPWLTGYTDLELKEHITTYVVGRYVGLDGKAVGHPQSYNFINTAFQQSGRVFDICVPMGGQGRLIALLRCSTIASTLEAFLASIASPLIKVLAKGVSLFSYSVKKSDDASLSALNDFFSRFPGTEGLVKKAPKLVATCLEIAALHSIDTIIQALKSGGDPCERNTGSDDQWPVLTPDQTLDFFGKRSALSGDELVDAVDKIPDALQLPSALSDLVTSQSSKEKKAAKRDDSGGGGGGGGKASDDASDGSLEVELTSMAKESGEGRSSLADQAVKVLQDSLKEPKRFDMSQRIAFEASCRKCVIEQGLGWGVNEHNRRRQRLFRLEPSDVALFESNYSSVINREVRGNTSKLDKQYGGEMEADVGIADYGLKGDMHGNYTRDQQAKDHKSSLVLIVRSVRKCKINLTDDALWARAQRDRIAGGRYIHSGIWVAGYRLSVIGDFTSSDASSEHDFGAGASANKIVASAKVSAHYKNEQEKGQKDKVFCLKVEGFGDYNPPFNVINFEDFKDNLDQLHVKATELHHHFIGQLPFLSGNFEYTRDDIKRCQPSEGVSRLSEQIDRLERRLANAVVSKPHCISFLRALRADFLSDIGANRLGTGSVDVVKGYAMKLAQQVQLLKKQGTIFYPKAAFFMQMQGRYVDFNSRYLSFHLSCFESSFFVEKNPDGGFLIKSGSNYLSLVGDCTYGSGICMVRQKSQAQPCQFMPQPDGKFTIAVTQSLALGVCDDRAILVGREHQDVFRFHLIDHGLTLLLSRLQEQFNVSGLSPAVVNPLDFSALPMPLTIKTQASIDALMQKGFSELDKVSKGSLIYVVGQHARDRTAFIEGMMDCPIGPYPAQKDYVTPYACSRNDTWVYCNVPTVESITPFSINVSQWLASSVKAIVVLLSKEEKRVLRAKPVSSADYVRTLSALFKRIDQVNGCIHLDPDRIFLLWPGSSVKTLRANMTVLHDKCTLMHEEHANGIAQGIAGRMGLSQVVSSLEESADVMAQLRCLLDRMNCYPMIKGSLSDQVRRTSRRLKREVDSEPYMDHSVYIWINRMRSYLTYYDKMLEQVICEWEAMYDDMNALLGRSLLEVSRSGNITLSFRMLISLLNRSNDELLHLPVDLEQCINPQDEVVYHQLKIHAVDGRFLGGPWWPHASVGKCYFKGLPPFRLAYHTDSQAEVFPKTIRHNGYRFSRSDGSSIQPMAFGTLPGYCRLSTTDVERGEALTYQSGDFFSGSIPNLTVDFKGIRLFDFQFQASLTKAMNGFHTTIQSLLSFFKRNGLLLSMVRQRKHASWATGIVFIQNELLRFQLHLGVLLKNDWQVFEEDSFFQKRFEACEYLIYQRKKLWLQSIRYFFQAIGYVPEKTGDSTCAVAINHSSLSTLPPSLQVAIVRHRKKIRQLTDWIAGNAVFFHTMITSSALFLKGLEQYASRRGGVREQMDDIRQLHQSLFNRYQKLCYLPNESLWYSRFFVPLIDPLMRSYIASSSHLSNIAFLVHNQEDFLLIRVQLMAFNFHVRQAFEALSVEVETWFEHAPLDAEYRSRESSIVFQGSRQERQRLFGHVHAHYLVDKVEEEAEKLSCRIM